MVAKPTIEDQDIGLVNVWPTQGMLPKLCIVNHIMQGSLEGCVAWFKNPAAQASSNFGVGKTGRIVQFVSPLSHRAPYANGLVQAPDATVQAMLGRTGNINPNYYSVSIEHEGMSGQPMPAAQLDASAHLAAWLCDLFGIPADEDHLWGHYEVDSVTRAQCPGWNRDTWVAYEAAIAGYLNPPPAPDPCAGLAAQVTALTDHLATANVQLTAAKSDLQRQTAVVAAVRAAVGG